MTNLTVELDRNGRGSVMVDGMEIPGITQLDVSFKPGRPAEATFTVIANEVLVRADDASIEAIPYELRGGVPYPRVGDPISHGTVF